jgi:hypothetical protein
MAALFGGIVGQEVCDACDACDAYVLQVVKAASGKFHPIHQVRILCVRVCVVVSRPPAVAAVRVTRERADARRRSRAYGNSGTLCAALM